MNSPAPEIRGGGTRHRGKRCNEHVTTGIIRPTGRGGNAVDSASCRAGPSVVGLRGAEEVVAVRRCGHPGFFPASRGDSLLHQLVDGPLAVHHRVRVRMVVAVRRGDLRGEERKCRRTRMSARRRRMVLSPSSFRCRSLTTTRRCRGPFPPLRAKERAPRAKGRAPGGTRRAECGAVGRAAPELRRGVRELGAERASIRRRLPRCFYATHGVS